MTGSRSVLRFFCFIAIQTDLLQLLLTLTHKQSEKKDSLLPPEVRHRTQLTILTLMKQTVHITWGLGKFTLPF